MASVLDNRSKWPETALANALNSDPEIFVRYAAFQSLLELAGVPLFKAFDEHEKVKSGEIQPTWSEVQRIIAENGIDLAAFEQ